MPTYRFDFWHEIDPTQNFSDFMICTDRRDAIKEFEAYRLRAQIAERGFYVSELRCASGRGPNQPFHWVYQDENAPPKRQTRPRGRLLTL